MRAADYPYPPDEFDAAAAGGPQGVHRRPRSSWSRWWPFLLVLVVVPGLAYGAVTVATGGNPFSSGESSTTSTATTDASSPEPTAEETATEEPTEEPTATEEPLPAADLGAPVDVQNATTTSGLASGAKTLLTDAGFTAVTSGNFAGETPAASVVYYAAAEDAGTAAAVAAALGIGVVEESADAVPDGILVVLAGDYQP
ncbi:LytR C-terminal domain-containing protein [Actinotalea sp.]|uniref:LytR C-terminal domain-containing protein n=1 Tax=Actinotalea sp. TaxID=1872145 RepID=UPI00356700D1